MLLLLHRHPQCQSLPREQGETSSFPQPPASLPKASSCCLTRALPSPWLHWVLLAGSLGHPSHQSGPQPTREAGLGSRAHTQPEGRTRDGHKHSSEQEERPRPDPKYIPSQWVHGCRFQVGLFRAVEASFGGLCSGPVSEGSAESRHNG